MSGKALRLAVVSALSFCLILGIGIVPALAMHAMASGASGATLAATAAVKAEPAAAQAAVKVSAAAASASAPAARAVKNAAVPAAARASAAVGGAPRAAVAAQDGGNEVEFAGTIQAITGSVWTVNGITFTVDITTQIRPSATLAIVGAFVGVEAVRLPDTTLLAREIVVLPAPVGDRQKRVEFRGVIQSFSASVWMVAGRTVNISPTTQIEGTPVVGAMAEVEAVVKPDGSLWALKIQVEQAEVEKERVEFKGVISAFNATQWVVGGRTVLISTTTQISGTPQIGLIAEVQALKVGTTLTALKIRVLTPKPKAVAIDGKITSISGNTWVINGKTVTIVANTQIDQSRGPVKVGAKVQVKGVLQADGSILAQRVRVQGR